jgi:hypothetical protein
MNYQYAVFLSYKWDGDYAEWVDKIFYPIVKNFFIDNYGDNYAYKDTEQVPGGGNLPILLRQAIARSMCMIAVLNGPYFCKSSWCTVEFSSMLHRQKALKYPEANNGRGLLFPVIFTKTNQANNAQISTLIDKCPNVAQLVEGLLPLKLEEDRYFHVHNSFKDSPEYGMLRTKIRSWLENSVVPSIVAPPPAQDWEGPEWFDQPSVEFRRLLDCKSIILQPLIN